MKIIDRVESKKAQIVLLFTKIAAVVVLVLMIIMATTKSNVRFSDFKDFIIGFILLLNLNNIFNKRKGQFIEWPEDEIEYKTRDEEATIELKDIKNVSIHLDTINIKSIQNQDYKIDIQDFTDYKTRLRIKENFTKLQRHS